MSSPLASLALGGAQFGLDYGVSNRRGRIPFGEVEKILTRASEAGVTTIDTAPAYGDSEEVIGSILGDDSRWRIITKTVDLSQCPAGAAAAHFADGVRQSLVRLRRRTLDTLLFHRSADLARADAAEILGAAEDLRRAGSVRRLGVSIYEQAELEGPAGAISWDVVQAPLSVLDQRMLRSGELRHLAAAGTEVHARSVLLQGLLACRAEVLPPFVARFASSLRRVAERARALDASPVELCLAFARRVPGVSVCLVGLSGIGDLDQALAEPVPNLPDLSDLAVPDVDLIDPRRWPARRYPSP